MKTKITRISQVMGTILPEPGNDTFEKAQEIIVKWLNKKLDKAQTPETHDGHFVYTDNKGQNAEHLTFDLTDNQKVWILTYSHPCNDIPTRRWATEAAIAIKPNGSLFFGVRLNAHDTRLEHITSFMHSTPNLVRDLASELKLITDGDKILLEAEQVKSQSSIDTFDVDALVENIYRPTRKQPIIVVSADRSGKTLINPNALARTLAGVAHVYAVDDSSSYLLTERVGRPLATYNGAIRLYPPVKDGIISNRHFYTSESKFRTQPLIIQKQLSDVSFLTALESAVGEDAFPSFSTIKNFYFQNIRSELEKKPEAGENDDKNKKIIHAQRQQIQALQSEVNEAFSLAAEEEDKRKKEEAARLGVENELETVKRLLAETSEQLRLMPNVTLLRKGTLYPDLSMLGQWAADHFPEELVITRRAQKSAEKSIFAEPDLIYRGLIYLSREYRNSVLYSEMSSLDGGVRNLRRESQERLAQLKLENRPSLSREFASLYGEDYYVSHNGEKYFLDMHLAKGAARDPKRCLRIYYTYDGDETKIIVGHLPTHLKNQMT